MAQELTVKQKKDTLTAYTFAKTLADNLKPKADAIMRQDYAEDGIEKRTARIDGKPIGTISVAKKKGVYEVVDPDAFTEWLENYDYGSCAHKVNEAASDEIYKMLLKYYAPEDIEHLFTREPVVYRETEKRIFVCDDVCLLEGMPAVIPGIRPVTNNYHHMTVKDTSVNTCMNLLINNENTVKLLGSVTKEEE